MRYFVPIFLIFSSFFCSCDRRNDALWEEEKIQIRAYLQSIGITDYTEDPESGYFYYLSDTDSVSNGRPNVNSEIEVLYTAKLFDGTVFYESDPAYPDFIYLSDAIPGWQLALPNFQIGAKGTIIIPSRLGYGEDGLTDEYGDVIVPPNSILIFDLQLVEIHPHF